MPRGRNKSKLLTPVEKKNKKSKKDRNQKIREKWKEFQAAAKNGDNVRCQIITREGDRCTRDSMAGSRTYFHKIKCCNVCWQHAQKMGMYGVFKAVEKLSEVGLSSDQKDMLKAFNKLYGVGIPFPYKVSGKGLCEK